MKALTACGAVSSSTFTALVAFSSDAASDLRLVTERRAFSMARGARKPARRQRQKTAPATRTTEKPPRIVPAPLPLPPCKLSSTPWTRGCVGRSCAGIDGGGGAGAGDEISRAGGDGGGMHTGVTSLHDCGHAKTRAAMRSGVSTGGKPFRQLRPIQCWHDHVSK